MAWRTSKSPPPPRSALSKILPLIVLCGVLAIFGFVGYHVYRTANKIADKTSEKLEKKHVLCTRDGMKVRVKEVHTERYVDQTQGLVTVDAPSLR